MSNGADPNRTFTSLRVKEDSCEIDRLPTLPDRIRARVDYQVFKEFISICQDSITSDMTGPAKYKQSKKKKECQFCTVLVVLLIATGCFAVGGPLLSANENVTKSWEFAFAVSMMIMGVIIFIVGLVLWQRNEGQDEYSKRLTRIIRQKLRENFTELNEKYRDKICFTVTDLDDPNAIKIFIEIELKVQKVEWIADTNDN